MEKNRLSIRAGEPVNKPDEKRRHSRHPYGKPFRAVVGDEVHEGTVEDISAGGAALLTNANLGNDVFIELHVDGVGELPSRVVRQFDQGVGVLFDTAAAEPAAEEEKPAARKKGDDPLTDTIRIILDAVDAMKAKK